MNSVVNINDSVDTTCGLLYARALLYVHFVDAYPSYYFIPLTQHSRKALNSRESLGIPFVCEELSGGFT